MTRGRYAQAALVLALVLALLVATVRSCFGIAYTLTEGNGESVTRDVLILLGCIVAWGAFVLAVRRWNRVPATRD